MLINVGFFFPHGNPILLDFDLSKYTKLIITIKELIVVYLF